MTLPPDAAPRATRVRSVRHVLYATEARALSGGSRQVINNVRALLASGVSVSVATPAGTPVAETAGLAGARVLPWPARASALACAGHLRAIVADGGIDVVHACHTRAVKAAVLARVLGLRARVFLNRGVVTPANPLWGVFVRIADGAIANSAAAAATLVARRAPPSRVHVVYNSCGPSGDIEAALAAARRDAPPAHLPVTVAWVGNAHPAKGFDVLAAVARRVRATLGADAVRLLAVGVGPHDGRGTAATAGDVLELAGHLPHHEVLLALARSDLLVLTSRRRESLPNVITEAFALGLPVVATDVGGVAELVRDGVNGFVCAAGDEEGLARGVLALVEDPAARARMGALNRRLAAGRLTGEAKARSLLRVYGGDHVVEAPPVRWLADSGARLGI